MRTAKWIGIALLGLVVLLLAAAWLATRFVDPQRFKPQIAAAVRDATGRELQLRGPLALSWFPWLALEASDGALDGAGANSPLVRWRKLRVGARLLPLIDGQLNLDRVQIDGLMVHLQRDPSGVANWQSLLDRLRAPGGGSGYSLGNIAGVTLKDAAIDYRGADGKLLALQKLNLETGVIVAGKPIGLRADFDYLAPDSAAVTAVTIETVMTLQGDELALRNLETSVSWKPGTAANGAAPKSTVQQRVSLTAPAMKANLATQRWELPAATATVGTSTLQLSNATLTLADAGVLANGGFVLAPTSLRDLLTNAGIAPPATRDPRALGRFAASGTLGYSGAGLQLRLDALQLDDTRFSGTVTALTPLDITEFAIAGDSMDLDRYRSPENLPSEPFVFPTEKLAALRARGTLTLQQAQAMGADLRGVTLRLLFADGRLQSVPAEAPAAPAKRSVKKPKRKP